MAYLRELPTGFVFSGCQGRAWWIRPERSVHRAWEGLRPEDERQLLTYGCGITAAVSRATPRAVDVTASEFRAARPDFEEKMRCLEPRALAFLGKRAVVSMLEAPHISFGLQPFRFAEVTTWVLPNPSGLNRRSTLDALVDAYAELRMSLIDGSSTGRRPGPGHR